MRTADRVQVEWLGGLLAVLLAAPWAGATTITGRVVDETGAPPSTAWVAALDPADTTLIDQAETADGRYTVDVPEGKDVLLVAVPFSGGSVAGYELHGATEALARLVAEGAAMIRDLPIRRCHDYVLEVRRADGALYRNEELPGGSFPVDEEGEATAELVWPVSNPTTQVQAPSYCVPFGARRTLQFRIELPGAGLLDLPLELDGGFFGAGEQGGEVVDVNRELALTQLLRLEDRIAALTAAGTPPSAELTDRARAARSSFDGAEGRTPGERAGTELEVAAQAVRTLEDVELKAARRQAMVSRRGTLRVRVIGPDGAPLPGARITYRQTSHDFRFGVFGQLATTGQAVYDRMAGAGMNFVTAGFYWSDIEPEQGQIDYAHIDHEVGVVDLAARGWRIKGHPLTWLTHLAMPDWLESMAFPELKQASVDHVTSLITHYRQLVHTWDVNNEASGYWASGGLSRPQLDEYLRAVFSAARRADPTAELVLNSAFDWFGEARLQERFDGRSSYLTLSVPAFVQRALDTGVDFDVIGQQMYDGGGVTFFSDLGLGPVQGVATHDLGFLAQVLRRLSRFGKPIHVTEISVGGAWDPSWVAAGAGYWHEPWNEEIQADFLEAFYRLCFGTPAVRAITWWDGVDDNPFVNHGALFHADGTPKPAFLRLESLIAEWTTSGEMKTGGDGVGEVSGFAGEYSVSVELSGRRRERTVHVSEGRTTAVTVDLRGPRVLGTTTRVRPAVP